MDTTTATDLTTDALEQQLLYGESTIARVRAAQMTIIRELDRRQTPLADGSRSMAEWVTGRLDVAPETAKALVATARRLEALPTVETAIGAGSVSFDRATAVARIAEPSNDATIIDEMAVYDVAGIRRLRSNRHRMTRDMEREAFERRYVVAQPNLDESAWRVHGELPAMAGRSFVDALDQKADQLPPDPDGNNSRGSRWADALWAISLDSLAGTDGASIDNATPLLTVFMDTNDAAPTNGEAGVVIESGPRVGPSTVEAILCNGVVEVTGRTADGTPVNMGRRSRAIPPRLRRFILARDGGVCTVEGCVSRYRLDLRSGTEYSVLSTEYRRWQAARDPRTRIPNRPRHPTSTTQTVATHPRTTPKLTSGSRHQFVNSTDPALGCRQPAAIQLIQTPEDRPTSKQCAL